MRRAIEGELQSPDRHKHLVFLKNTEPREEQAILHPASKRERERG